MASCLAVLVLPVHAGTLIGTAMFLEQGLITTRPWAEPGQPPRCTLVMEKFTNLRPGKGCAPSPMTEASGRGNVVAPLRGTTWRLIDLRGATTPSQLDPKPRRPVELVFAAQEHMVAGSGGCNLLKGSFQLDGEQLRFGPLASTRMACPPALMAFERSYLERLAQVRRWSIDRRTLLLQDSTGHTLMVFQALS
jgi:heat shock protein HslJ